MLGPESQKNVLGNSVDAIAADERREKKMSFFGRMMAGDGASSDDDAEALADAEARASVDDDDGPPSCFKFFCGA